MTKGFIVRVKEFELHPKSSGEWLNIYKRRYD